MRSLGKRQQGAILFISLVILIAMTMMGLVLVRSVDTSNQVANNIGFKQSALASADNGTEQAIIWLTNNSGSLTAHNSGEGYYASEQVPIDYTGLTTPGDLTDDVDWTGGNGASLIKAKVVPGKDAAGNSIAYIIHRMCSGTGTFGSTSIECATSASTTSSGGSKGGPALGVYNIQSKTQIFYRITTRTLGLRNTASYVQAMVLIEY